ncbi:tubulin-specific chaperone C [Bombina bombina]|uniref:tubulin-specific chaperone C n=1 Tax=Bombina bombina TaxID=8345 RepID=UPI00235B06FC|nr:tubulin-specific chaperone C [Bombina bombina]
MEPTVAVSEALRGPGEVDGDRLGRLPERLQKREQERIRETERRREEKESQAVLEEKSGYFSAGFEPERAALEEQLSATDSVCEPRVLEEITGRLQQLQKLLNDSMRFLSPYDIRKAQEALTRLQAVLDEKRKLQQPKKFAFKSRKKEPTAGPAPQPPPDQQTVPAKVPDPEPSSCGFQDLTSQVLFMEPAEIQQRDLLLCQLRDCTVTLRGSPATLHLRGLHGCRVLCGPVSSSVFVDGCTDCIFTFPCQQLRTHSTSNTRFYLHVTSRAIIEDCSGLYFAPFNWTYDGILQDYKVSGLDITRNNWNQVDDFNWLASDASSPNWCVIPEDSRIAQWN